MNAERIIDMQYEALTDNMIDDMYLVEGDNNKMFVVEVEEEVFKLFHTEREAEDLMAEIADSRAEGYGKERWNDVYSEIYTEWADKCQLCEDGYIMPNLICNYCEATRENEELDEADLHDLEQANKGFCSDIILPKGFKFIEVNE